METRATANQRQETVRYIYELLNLSTKIIDTLIDEGLDDVDSLLLSEEDHEEIVKDLPVNKVVIGKLRKFRKWVECYKETNLEAIPQDIDEWKENFTVNSFRATPVALSTGSLASSRASSKKEDSVGSERQSEPPKAIYLFLSR